ncbi:hypothetical protein CEXT_466061 [Caerostris extrusa]|uniref:Uncharacterized protein n=1 Tax=Caerostris extrusa TaxID=172846 RepID=A0AAV4XXH4_CAEEX|nr:hypothetical protein CEXT_466061 [Caerostris extrusa]
MHSKELSLGKNKSRVKILKSNTPEFIFTQFRKLFFLYNYGARLPANRFESRPEPFCAWAWDVMGNKLSCSCAPLIRKAYRYEDSPWNNSRRRDGHLLRSANYWCVLPAAAACSAHRTPRRPRFHGSTLRSPYT